MTFKKYILILIFLLTCLIPVKISAGSPPVINAESFVLMDMDTGIIIYSQNEDKKIYPASTTKILTALVALENMDVNTVMTASTEAVNDIGVGGMNIGIMSGEEMTLYELLHGLLIPSANEAANIIAENTASSRQDFFVMMNRKAVSLGLINSNFVNANGLHNVDHYSTAKDMAVIAREAMQYDVFREIVSKRSYDLTPTNKHPKWDPIYNTNRILRFGTSAGINFEITGIKTGFTTPAGHNLITGATGPDGTRLISVIHGVKEDRSWETIYTYTEQLLKYGFDNYKRMCLLDDTQVVTTLVPDKAQEDTLLKIVSENPVYVLCGDDIDYSRKIVLKPVVEAPVKKGDNIGYIRFYHNGTLISEENLIALNSVDMEIVKSSFDGFDLEKTAKIVLVPIVFFLLLRIVLKMISKRYRRKRRKLT